MLKSKWVRGVAVGLLGLTIPVLAMAAPAGKSKAAQAAKPKTTISHVTAVKPLSTAKGKAVIAKKTTKSAKALSTVTKAKPKAKITKATKLTKKPVAAKKLSTKSAKKATTLAAKPALRK